MLRTPFFARSAPTPLVRCFLAALTFLPALALAAPTALPINGQDVDGRAVAVNGKGHFTLVMYTNPDLEDESRLMTKALDSFRSRSNFNFVRVVDLRGEVPANLRSVVRGQIRKEQAKESARLKKAGVEASPTTAPIIPDFSGSTLDALGWDNTYDEVHLVFFDPHGKEIKRLEKVTDAKQVTKAVESVL